MGSTAIGHRESLPRVCVMGLGYVGLPSAALLANRGYDVHGVDVDAALVESIVSGTVHALEPGLDAWVREARAAGRLRASGKPVPSDVFLICVPTPCDPEHAADLAYVQAAMEAVLEVLVPGNLVILESTVPPRSTQDTIGRRLEQAGFCIGEDVFVAHAPERILPGSALRELEHGTRIVGGLTAACTQKATTFYAGWLAGAIKPTTALVAELSKLAENSFRDVNIAFANQLAAICEDLGADPWTVIRLANQHPRVEILRPGPGVGGHCIPVDPWFLATAAPEHSALLRTARSINDERPHQVLARAERLLREKSTSTLACLGLTYKANSDDIRNSPALQIARTLVAQHPRRVRVCDPCLSSSPISSVILQDLSSAVEEADLLLVLVAHDAFRRLSPHALRGKSVVDAVGLWES